MATLGHGQSPGMSKFSVLCSKFRVQWLLLSYILICPPLTSILATRLTYGNKNCTPQSHVDNQIYRLMDQENVRLLNAGKASLCPDPNVHTCVSQTLKPNEWTVTAENYYMNLFMNRSDVCELNLLLECTQYIPPEGPHEWECKCRQYSTKDIPVENSNISICAARVGYPCAFRVANNLEPEQLKLSSSGYTCGTNMECIPPEDFSKHQNNSMQARVNDTAGIPTNEASWPPQMIAYINRRIANVCVCVEGFAIDGHGDCISIDHASTVVSSNKSISNYDPNWPTMVVLSANLTVILLYLLSKLSLIFPQ